MADLPQLGHTPAPETLKGLRLSPLQECQVGVGEEHTEHLVGRYQSSGVPRADADEQFPQPGAQVRGYAASHPEINKGELPTPSLRFLWRDE